MAELGLGLGEQRAEKEGGKRRRKKNGGERIPE
jgi:hypothetical protein